MRWCPWIQQARLLCSPGLDNPVQEASYGHVVIMVTRLNGEGVQAAGSKLSVGPACRNTGNGRGKGPEVEGVGCAGLKVPKASPMHGVSRMRLQEVWISLDTGTPGVGQDPI